MRISKYFSLNKILSRRETENYIRQGKISVNGKVVTDLGRQIDPDIDVVEIIGVKDIKTTVLLNKPRGITTPEIFINYPQFNGLNAVGRLDKDTEGLILLSNDGTLTNVVTGKEHLIEKEYEVHVKENVTQTQMNALSSGVYLNDGITLPAKTTIINKHKFSLTLTEGRNHQVRRMANAVRLNITDLVRVRIGHLTISKLEDKEYMTVSPEDVDRLKSNSSNNKTK